MLVREDNICYRLQDRAATHPQLCLITTTIEGHHPQPVRWLKYTKIHCSQPEFSS